MDRWPAELVAGIRHLQSAGEIPSSTDPSRAASALLAGVQAGVTMLLSTGHAGYLEAALEVGIENLRRKGS